MLRMLAFLACVVCASRCVYSTLTIARPVLMTKNGDITLSQEFWLQLRIVERSTFCLRTPAFVDTLLHSSFLPFLGRSSNCSSSSVDQETGGADENAHRLVLQLPLIHMLPGFWIFNAVVLMSVHAAFKIATRPDSSGVVIVVAMVVSYYVAYVTVSHVAQDPMWQNAKKIAVSFLTCATDADSSGDDGKFYDSQDYGTNAMIALFAPVYRMLLDKVGSNSLCLNRDRLLSWLNLVHDASPLACAGGVVIMSSAKAAWKAL